MKVIETEHCCEMIDSLKENFDELSVKYHGPVVIDKNGFMHLMDSLKDYVISHSIDIDETK